MGFPGENLVRPEHSFTAESHRISGVSAAEDPIIRSDVAMLTKSANESLEMCFSWLHACLSPRRFSPVRETSADSTRRRCNRLRHYTCRRRHFFWYSQASLKRPEEPRWFWACTRASRPERCCYSRRSSRSSLSGSGPSRGQWKCKQDISAHLTSLLGRSRKGHDTYPSPFGGSIAVVRPRLQVGVILPP